MKFEHRLYAALAALVLSSPLQAQERAKTAPVETLEEVVVTGSLIPMPKEETAAPLTTITAEDLQVRGFTTIADALQQSAFSTGSTQGAQFSGGFTQGAKTLSMFGLSPSYVKYLIDGLPMSDYPALYNGTDTFTSIGGIPMALVERIDILPGGQSSLYGSDAIAGVVNIVLKKKLDGAYLDARVGFTKDGGGTDKTVALADSFDFGRLNILAGVQYDKTAPIWGYQRGPTSNYFGGGTSSAVAERDYLVYGYFGPNGDGSNAYYFEDPANCANVAGLFGGTVGVQSRANRGQYCGTTRAGYYTINNGDESTQAYLRATQGLGEHTELYADLLYSNDVTTFSNGTAAYNTSFVNNQYSYFYDPNLNDYVNLQHIFSPEEVGNLNNTLSESVTNMARGTIGIRAPIGGTSWTYDVSATYNEQRLAEREHLLLTQPLEAFYAPLFGPNLGDPINGPAFTPDYAAFYKPVTPAQYASFSGRLTNYSRTENTLFRGQLTDSALFTLPGGKAGIALVAEGGRQSWSYDPDPGFLNGDAFGYTASGSSGGNRTRSAFTTELRLPVLQLLTVNASGRYDDYKVEGGHFSKATYTLGVEFRPVDTVMVRGRYGTAFKAPTLSDEFQGASGFYVGATDYWQCALRGFTGANIPSCPLSGNSVFGTTQGNTSLKPINAKVWNTGIVWTPTAMFSLDVDYLHWQITDEVAQQSTDQLLQTESECRLGHLDITSPTCVAALSQVTRDPTTNAIVSVFTPKVNVSQEAVNAFTLTANYRLEAGRIGTFDFQAAWTDMTKHTYQQYPGDPMIDLLGNPYWSTDFKSKVNGSVTWHKGDWATTVYVTRNGRTPNYLATLLAAGYATPGAGTLPAWTLANLNVSWTPIEDLQLSASIINVFDKMPPTDASYPGTSNQPYNIFDYNPYGRSFLLQARYHFGKKKN